MKDDFRSDTGDRECLPVERAPISARRQRTGQAALSPVELSAGLRYGISLVEASCGGKPGLDRPLAVFIDVAPTFLLHHRGKPVGKISGVVKRKGNHHCAGWIDEPPLA